LSDIGNLISGLDPLAGFGPAAIAWVFFAHFCGCFVRGAFGFGSNMPIVLMTTWVLGPHHAILLSVLTTTVAQFQLFQQGVKTADWPVARPLLVWLAIGIAVGLALFIQLKPDWLTLVLGALMCGVLLMDRLRVLAKLAERIDIRALPITASLAAVSGAVGTVGGGGALYFLMIYLRMACATPASLRGTGIVLTAVFVIVRFGGLLLAGMFTATLFAEGLLLVPVALLGGWVGTKAFRAATTAQFYYWLQVLMLCGAAALMIRGALKVIA
jgi:uncharacterized membrane protein YfcA